jgi:hypothetical protein
MTRTPWFWGATAVAFVALCFLPVIPVYKGQGEPAFFWPLGLAWFGLISEPDWIGWYALAAVHLLVSVAGGVLGVMVVRPEPGRGDR